MQFACRICGRISNESRCERHRRQGDTSWGQNRDRTAQARFRKEVLSRDGHRCTYLEPDGSRCWREEDLRACHIIPLRDFVPGDSTAYDVQNGTTRCPEHDKMTDSFAR